MLTRRPVLTLLLMSLLVMGPVLVLGHPQGHDSVYHVPSVAHYADQMFDGEIFPRWLADMDGGYGGPVGFLYPPLAYAVTALLRPLAPGWEGVPYTLGLSVSLAAFLSALFMYLWARYHLRKKGALIAAALYTLLPYHHIVDVNIRAALAETWAFVWVPLVFRGVDLAGKRFLPGLLVTAAGTGLLLLTHAPTSLVVLPCVGIAALARATARRSPRILLATASGGVLGAGLAGFFLATALTHLPYVDLAGQYGGKLSYEHWFIFGGVHYENLTFEVLVQGGLLAMAVCTIVAFILSARAGSTFARRWGWTLSSIAAVCLFLQFSPSRFVWENLEVLQRIQFPWRMSVLLVFTTSAALGSLAQSWPGHHSGRVALANGTTAVVIGALLLLNIGAGLGDHPPEATWRRVIEKSENIPMHRVPRREDPESLFPESARIRFVDGDALDVAEVREWRPRRLAFSVRTHGPALLAVRHQSYPGWVARAEGRDLEFDTDRLRERCGILSVYFPEAFSGEVTLILGDTPNERLGWIVSGASACLLVLLLILAIARRKR